VQQFFQKIRLSAQNQRCALSFLYDILPYEWKNVLDFTILDLVIFEEINNDNNAQQFEIIENH